MNKVLIVEDHASMRESLAAALTAAVRTPVIASPSRKCPMPTMPWISASICIRT